jgi:O-antigen ligase
MDSDLSLRTDQPTRCDVLCLLTVALLPLFSYPLSWLPAGWTQFRYVICLPWGAILLCFILLLAAAKLPAARLALPPRNVLWPCGLLVLSWLLSVCLSQNRSFSVLALPAVLGNAALLSVACFFSGTRLRELCWVWLLVASAVAANALLRLGREHEFVSTIGNRNFLGAYLAASIPIAVALRDKRATVLGAVLITALCFTRSRGAWSALAVVGALWATVVWTRGSIRKRLVALAGITGLAVLLGLLGRGYAEDVWHTDVRPVIWKGTLHMIAARPVVGHGLGTYWAQYPAFRLPEYFTRPKAGNFTNHAHNELLEVAAEQGIVGLVAVLWLWAAALTAGVRAASPARSGARTMTVQDHLRWGLVGATLVFMLHGMVDVDLRSPPNQTLLWLLLGVLASGSDAPRTLAPIRSQPARSVLAGACLLTAVWIFYGGVVQPVRADDWERKARLAEVTGDLNAAARAARQSLEIQPLRVETLYFLAGVLAEDPATYQQAIDEGLMIESIAPDYSDLTSNIGELYLKLRQPDRALPFLQRAVKINPYSAPKRFALALALVESSQTGAAEEELRTAIRLKPGYTEAVALLQQLGSPRSPTR